MNQVERGSEYLKQKHQTRAEIGPPDVDEMLEERYLQKVHQDEYPAEDGEDDEQSVMPQ